MKIVGVTEIKPEMWKQEGRGAKSAMMRLRTCAAYYCVSSCIFFGGSLLVFKVEAFSSDNISSIPLQNRPRKVPGFPAIFQKVRHTFKICTTHKNLLMTQLLSRQHSTSSSQHFEGVTNSPKCFCLLKITDTTLKRQH